MSDKELINTNDFEEGYVLYLSSSQYDYLLFVLTDLLELEGEIPPEFKSHNFVVLKRIV